jgi:hypothetical protein
VNQPDRTPTMGEPVRYSMPGKRPEDDNGERPAVVLAAYEDGTLDLQVYANGRFDGDSTGLFWITAARFDPTRKPGTWHWPPTKPKMPGPPVEHPAYAESKDRIERPQAYTPGPKTAAPPAPAKSRICPQHGRKDCPDCYAGVDE